MNWSLVGSAIPINESFKFIFIESFEFTGSVVPIASQFMVRSEFYNGAPLIRFYFSNQPSQFLLTRSSLFFVRWADPFNDESVLYWCFITQIFYEMTHRPYILELYIINIFFLPLILPFIHTLYFFLLLKQIF